MEFNGGYRSFAVTREPSIDTHWFVSWQDGEMAGSCPEGKDVFLCLLNKEIKYF